MIRSQYMNFVVAHSAILIGWTDKKNCLTLKKTIINMAKLFFILFLEIIQ